MSIRILAATFLFLEFGAIVGILIYMGISKSNWIVVAIGIVIALFIVWAVWRTIKDHRRKK